MSRCLSYANFHDKVAYNSAVQSANDRHDHLSIFGTLLGESDVPVELVCPFRQHLRDLFYIFVTSSGQALPIRHTG